MTLTLVPTTSEEEIRECQRQNYATWGGRYTLQGYQDRDWNNYARPYMNNLHRRRGELGGVYFVLKNEEGEIESGCEILLRKGWVKLESGDIESCTSAVVGSVYTQERYRGKGNASTMMAQLNGLLDREYLAGEHDVAFLYSEIGDYYAQFGYESLEEPVYTFAADQFSAPAPAKHTLLTSSTDWAPIAAELRASVYSSLVSAGGRAFALQPVPDIFAWFAVRAQADASNSRLARTIPMGASFHDDKGRLNFVVSVPSAAGCTVVAMVAHSPRSRDTLLALVAQGLPKGAGIEVWRSDYGDMSGAPIGAHVTANSSVSALRMAKIKNWVGNGKWCWF